MFKEISLDSVDLMFGEAVITVIKWADAISYNFQLVRCDMNCINIIPFSLLVCLGLRRRFYMPETWDRHGFCCVHCAFSPVYDGVLTLTVKEPIPTFTSMDTTAMACNYELDV
jgi:hypothetical protein